METEYCPTCKSAVNHSALVCSNCRQEIPRLWEPKLEPPCRICAAHGRTSALIFQQGNADIMVCPYCHSRRNISQRRGQMVTLSFLEMAPKPGTDLGTVAIILAFLFPLVGLILGIISAARGQPRGVAAIALAILMPIIYFAACSLAA